MPDLMTILTGGGDAESCRHGIPHRVSVSLQFVAMMRQTAARPAYEGGPVGELPQTKAEQGAYSAALDCLRVYFNGEHFADPDRRSGGPDNDERLPPTAGVGSPAPSPPAPAPVGAR